MNTAKKIIFVNLPFEKIYEETSMKSVAPTTPPLSLACLAGSVLEAGHYAEIFDFNIATNNEDLFIEKLQSIKPEYIGITFVTPLIREADKLSLLIKKHLPAAIIIAGGPHSSSFPESTLEETNIDIVVIGEGDFTISEIVSGQSLESIQGILYKKDGQNYFTEKRPYIKDLDVLPFPAYNLYDFHKYMVPAAIAKKNPVAWVETSRGCVFGCIYCNKSCFGQTFRFKSPERVAEEFKKIADLGFKEIHLTDDGFTTNIDRAKKICDLLIQNKSSIGWSTITGIRVDRVDLELLQKMKQAGCYRVYFGIESGSQTIINNIKKGIKLEQVVQAVQWAKKAGLEVAGYFMIGLPGETTQTMQETINFAIKLKLDLAKMSITIPLPGTPMFNDLREKSLIKTYDWEKFKFYTTPSEIYDHPNLSWPVILKYYTKFYRLVYLNPHYLINKLIKSIREKTLIDDIKMALSIRWF